MKNRADIVILSSVTNGAELIAYLEAIKNEIDFPHLIILDQNMPKLNGKETLSALRADTRYNKIDIVIYSTYADQKLIQECTGLGAIMVLAKPVSFEGYNQMISSILSVI